MISQRKAPRQKLDVSDIIRTANGFLRNSPPEAGQARDGVLAVVEVLLARAGAWTEPRMRYVEGAPEGYGQRPQFSGHLYGFHDSCVYEITCPSRGCACVPCSAERKRRIAARLSG